MILGIIPCLAGAKPELAASPDWTSVLPGAVDAERPKTEVELDGKVGAFGASKMLVED